MTDLQPGSPFKVPYSPLPCGESRTMRFQVDWTAVTDYTINFNLAIEQKKIDSIQSVYVDNRDNTNDVSIETGALQQRMTVQAGAQAFLPILAPNPADLKITSTIAAGQITRVFANNFPVPAIVWPAAATISGTVTVEGTVTVDSITDPVTVDSITDPVTVDSITDPVEVFKADQWTVTDLPAANTLATATRAAQGGGTFNVIEAFSFSLSGFPSSSGDLSVRVRDGAGGAILWQQRIYHGEGQNAIVVTVSDLRLRCSDNTAAVIEFSAIPGDASLYESVSMEGVTE